MVRVPRVWQEGGQALSESVSDFGLQKLSGN